MGARPTRVEEVIDRAALDSLLEGADDEGLQVFAKVVASYCSGQMLRDARDAIEAADWGTLERSAHNLKGLSYTLGAGEVASVAAELEKDAVRGVAESCRQILGRAEEAHRRAHDALKESPIYDAELVAQLAPKQAKK